MRSNSGVADSMSTLPWPATSGLPFSVAPTPVTSSTAVTIVVTKTAERGVTAGGLEGPEDRPGVDPLMEVVKPFTEEGREAEYDAENRSSELVIDGGRGLKQRAKDNSDELVRKNDRATANAVSQRERLVEEEVEKGKPDSFEIIPNPANDMEAKSLWKATKLLNEGE
ncbi:hypothetical protein QAD02_003505 [Eretmocerus hayati]|uniref:Uncharacterized protein n=1 Tax=Eretmocerus hayati TaxID=131215 RepID=A0ACC2NM88_9HYME|nr:hypothetical protein QAD02_003505 [Eretmocerus hayati]